MNPSDSFRVELANGDSWITLSIWLGEEFTGGQVIRLLPAAKFAVEGADELSATYGQANWSSGLASGAFYAYRTLGATRRIVWLSEFTGRLRSADMDAVGAAAAYAVARCLHHEAISLDLDGWQAKVSDVAGTETKQVAAIAG
jgi:hypothetical protein